MPTFASSAFVVDLPTLCVVTVFITVSGGLLLMIAWLQSRSEPALALWGLGFMLGSAGAAMLALGGAFDEGASIVAGSALICCAYGVMWAGARSFEGRRVRVAPTLAGAAIWIAACQSVAFYDSAEARLDLVSAILAAYVLLGAREVWHARDRELLSRWPTLALLVMHAGFLLARIPYAGALTPVPSAPGAHHPVVLVMTFEALFAAFCLAFLRVSMAKERAELAQRQAALTDSLTGIANRRAFFEFGETLLGRSLADGRRAALLLFDLDRFKEVNDTAGHQAGDRVLQVFCRLVGAAMRPGSLFARIGGEEFACLLLDTPMAEALRVAERVRGEFAASRFAGLTGAVTVSVGVAMASETASEAGGELPALLAHADRALYRAKSEGRNRVATAPPVLVEGSGEGGRQPSVLGGSAAILPAPLAG